MGLHPALVQHHTQHSLPCFHILEKGNDVFERRAKRVVLSAVIFIVLTGIPNPCFRPYPNFLVL